MRLLNRVLHGLPRHVPTQHEIKMNHDKKLKKAQSAVSSEYFNPFEVMDDTPIKKKEKSSKKK